MLIVYDSYTGLGKKFAESLGSPTQSVEISVNEPCILVTRNIGLGKITVFRTIQRICKRRCC